MDLNTRPWDNGFGIDRGPRLFRIQPDDIDEDAMVILSAAIFAPTPEKIHALLSQVYSASETKLFVIESLGEKYPGVERYSVHGIRLRAQRNDARSKVEVTWWVPL